MKQDDPSQTRRVAAADVLDDAVDLRDYPHRYVWVYADTTLKWLRLAMPRLLAAVEALEGQGWELVSILAKDNFYAVMRRG